MEDPLAIPAVNGDQGMKEDQLIPIEDDPILLMKDKPVRDGGNVSENQRQEVDGDEVISPVGVGDAKNRGLDDAHLKSDQKSVPVTATTASEHVSALSEDLCSALGGLRITVENPEPSPLQDKTEDTQSHLEENQVNEAEKQDSVATNLQEDLAAPLTPPGTDEEVTKDAEEETKEKNQQEEKQVVNVEEKQDIEVNYDDYVENVDSESTPVTVTENLVVEEVSSELSEQVEVEQVITVAELDKDGVNDTETNQSDVITEDNQIEVKNNADNTEDNQAKTEDTETERIENEMNIDTQENEEATNQTETKDELSNKEQESNHVAELKNHKNNTREEEHDEEEQTSPEPRGRLSSAGLGKNRTSWLYAHMLNETQSDEEDETEKTEQEAETAAEVEKVDKATEEKDDSAEHDTKKDEEMTEKIKTGEEKKDEEKGEAKDDVAEETKEEKPETDTQEPITETLLKLDTDKQEEQTETIEQQELTGTTKQQETPATDQQTVTVAAADKQEDQIEKHETQQSRRRNQNK
ncbi:chemotaxis regulatory protein ChePep-like [Portunus trituberculatus]|uniref:chemotaxis regulatory protein ChePep-like n=1 Tax=Portunus trituberculatus TaxID=210409 RepID=UPI001E1CE4CE|nr:chemotaxis regulatory protein ChePep-like [Portunus trituberculatus]